MVEYVGLAYFTETPVVIWDVQRIGPSTGLPTRTSQGDLRLAYYMGHGDARHVILFPGTVTECFEFGWKAFNIAERLQTPVIVLSDLDFGMNQWMAKPFEYPETPMDRGKILWEDELKQMTSKWGRYLDVDGDGSHTGHYQAISHPMQPGLHVGQGMMSTLNTVKTRSNGRIICSACNASWKTIFRCYQNQLFEKWRCKNQHYLLWLDHRCD